MNPLHPHRPRLSRALITVALLATMTDFASAQFRTQPGGGLNTGFGGSGFGNTGFGGSGFGNTGFGGSSGFLQQPGMGLNLAGRQNSANPFAATFGSPFGQAGNYGGQGGLNNFGGGQGLYGGFGSPYGTNNRGMYGNNMMGSNMMGGYGVGRTSSFVMRFPTPVPPALGVVDARVDRLLTNITGDSSEGRNIKLKMDGSTVVITGTVASFHQKQLAEAMLRLEPGVYELRNELQVTESGPAPKPTNE